LSTNDHAKTACGAATYSLQLLLEASNSLNRRRALDVPKTYEAESEAVSITNRVTVQIPFYDFYFIFKFFTHIWLGVLQV